MAHKYSNFLYNNFQLNTLFYHQYKQFIYIALIIQNITYQSPNLDIKFKNQLMGGTLPQHYPQSVQKIHINGICLNRQKLLQLYDFVCENFDQNLGRLQIYRKKQYNFDYVAIADKIVDRQYVQELNTLIKIYTIVSNNLQSTTNSSTQNYASNKLGPTGDYWVKTRGFEICQLQDKYQHYHRIKIYFQYFNFTIRDYIHNSPQNLYKPSSINISTMPPQIAYILISILDRYLELCTVKALYPNINIQPIITAITTPHFIYLDLEGCVRFISVPYYVMNDYASDVDKCMMHWCKYDSNPDTGTNNTINNTRIVQRAPNTLKPNPYEPTDKQFLHKFKKLIKYLKKQSCLAQQPQTSNSYYTNTRTHRLKTEASLGPENNKLDSLVSKQIVSNPITLPLGNVKPSSGSNSYNGSNKFWEELEAITSVNQYLNYLGNVEDVAQCLDIAKNKNNTKGAKVSDQTTKNLSNIQANNNSNNKYYADSWYGQQQNKKAFNSRMLNNSNKNNGYNNNINSSTHTNTLYSNSTKSYSTVKNNNIKNLQGINKSSSFYNSSSFNHYL